MSAPSSEGIVTLAVCVARAAAGATSRPPEDTLADAVQSAGVRLIDGDLVLPGGVLATGHAVLTALAASTVLDQLGVEARIDGTVMVKTLDIVRNRLEARVAAGEPEPERSCASEIAQRPERNSAPLFPAGEHDVTLQRRGRWWGGSRG